MIDQLVRCVRGVLILAGVNTRLFEVVSVSSKGPLLPRDSHMHKAQIICVIDFALFALHLPRGGSRVVVVEVVVVVDLYLLLLLVIVLLHSLLPVLLQIRRRVRLVLELLRLQYVRRNLLRHF